MLVNTKNIENTPRTTKYMTYNATHGLLAAAVVAKQFRCFAKWRKFTKRKHVL